MTTLKATGRKKVLLSAVELKDAEATHISLVPRGANRIPFKALKSSGEDMINLSQIFSSKKAETVPTAVAVIAKKGFVQSTLAHLKEQGIEVVDKIEQEDGVVLKLESDIPEENVVYKTSEKTAVVLTNTQKAFNSFPDGGTFVEKVQAMQFYPSLYLGMDALTDVIREAMYKAESGDMPTAEITQAIDEFKTYVLDALGTIPEMALKFEGFDPAEDEPEEVSKDDTDAEGEKTEKGESAESDKDKATKDDSAAEGGDPEKAAKDEGEGTPKEENSESTAKDEDSEAESETPNDEPSGEQATKQDSELSELTSIVKTLKDSLGESITGITQKLDAMEKAGKDMAEKLESVEKVANAAKDVASKAEEAVSGNLDLDNRDTDDNVSGGGYKPRAIKTAKGETPHLESV